MQRVVISSQSTCPPPSWALWQRFLIDKMNEAAPVFQERYTRKDGSLVWRQQWPGFDGSDDGYESFHNWPLFYALGGSADLHERSRHAWEAVTQQFTEYGQVWREYDANYDWMHHGESSIYIYYFGLADPCRLRDRARTLRFAGFYLGEDEEAPNWDAAHRLIRSPINGSRGPRIENQWEDWATHRAVLADYPAPFEDISPAHLVGPEYIAQRPHLARLGMPVADWNDDATYAEILRLLNERMMQGDVPLNLTSTSLITTAFLYTGDAKYKTWVLNYLEAWNERIAANGGLCPDNVGPNGIIGEMMDGKWWGGYYGWRWPHGFNTIIQPLTIAAMNAVLLTGDMGYLDIPRAQLDRMMELGRVEGGEYLIPNRRVDAGWIDYRPVKPEYPIQIWNMSQSPADRARLDRLPQQDVTWDPVQPGRGKGDDIHIAPWYRWVQGHNQDYPTRIMEAQWAEVARRMAEMAGDDGNPEDWDVHHWQNINPVHTEGLIQLTCGGPQIIYHGGLLHVRVRYYDVDARRPGLPPDVGAMVDHLRDDGARVTLVNTNPLVPRRLLIQAGAFGEHTITQAQDLAGPGTHPVAIQDKWLQVDLAAGGLVQLELAMKRYSRVPSYEQPI